MGLRVSRSDNQYICLLRPYATRHRMVSSCPSSGATILQCTKGSEALPWLLPDRFECFLENYSIRSADLYFKAVLRRVFEIGRSRPLLIFLDPDTGLEPSRGGDDSHLRITDLAALVSAISQHDKIVIYQHAHRKTNWLQHSCKRLEQDSRFANLNIHSYQLEKVAKDVGFLILTKKHS